MADEVLTWERFDTFRQAREKFRKRPCVYVLVGEDGEFLYLGESGDLWRRYCGGTGSMVDAALVGSNKTTYAAAAPSDQSRRRIVEGSLTYKYKPRHCVHNKWVRPPVVLEVEHRGDVPLKLV